MSTKNVKRGFDPYDTKIFSKESIAELKIAQEEIQWLLDRGYKIKQIIEFTGNHYLLSSRARTALQRTTSSTADYEKRKMKEKNILSILKNRLNVKFNEKTLFEKDNLDVIITNLESDHIYGSFNNLKKSTKKRI